MSSRTTVLNSVSLNIVFEMSSLLECLEWENKFSLDAPSQFDWHNWIEHVVQTAQLPVYNIHKFCDVAAVFDMAQHAKYYNSDIDLQPMNISHSLQTCLNVVQLYNYCQKQYFMQALYNLCARYTVGMVQIPCPSTKHMSNVPAIPYSIFFKLHSALGCPQHLYAWLKNVILYQSEQPFHVTLKLHVKSNVSGRRRRKQEAAAESAFALDNIVSVLTEQFEEIKNLSPQFAPILTCATNFVSTRNLSVTLHVKQQASHLQT